MRKWSWTLGQVRIDVVVGDLLAANASAVVNSEQTDFVLSSVEATVSGQLHRQCPAIQAELDRATRGLTLPAGTVLETSGPKGWRIFHAGFHEPDQLFAPDEEEPASHLESIRLCTREILRRMAGSGLPSVAFPLIGTGEFGLPAEAVAEMLFEEVAIFARDVVSAPMEVQFYVRDPEVLEDVVAGGTRGLARMLHIGRPLLSPAGGHPLVKEMRSTVRESADPFTQEKGILRFAEVASFVDLAFLASAAGKSLDLIRKRKRKGAAMTFGLIGDLIREVVAGESPAKTPEYLSARHQLLKSMEGQESLQRLIKDRNDEAHLRKPRSTIQMLDDVTKLYGGPGVDQDWAPDLPEPWMTSVGAEYGVLWSVSFAENEVEYLLPRTRASERRLLE